MSGTREVASGWFDALTGGDIERALGYLDEDVEWINYSPVPGFNDDMTWIGTCRGPVEVLESFQTFVGVVNVGSESLVRLVVDGEEAMGVIHETGTVKETGLPFEIEFIQWLTIRDGKITRWKSYTDPSQIIRAIRAR
ncbi:nuclear transport factor 2 family protein [Streptomyces sp. MP131-18]|uniref:nuclear transport factor 2 family protein n=1 Tax=Streptomyces sp. MP131-18 TaxID=1857892 RepID=UPI00097BCBCA|nr:nuclear transport factor 2 family protein [Streptomyces sp. MP131-18]ONK14134.1 Ketosteroid isomerase-related protein [Streptomyces sp. MP131-18]